VNTGRLKRLIANDVFVNKQNNSNRNGWKKNGITLTIATILIIVITITISAQAAELEAAMELSRTLDRQSQILRKRESLAAEVGDVPDAATIRFQLPSGIDY